METETRIITVPKELETRSEIRDGRQTLCGYACLYDTEAIPTDKHGRKFVEVFRRGCFDKTIADNHNILAFFDHAPKEFLGQTRSKSLKLWTDEKGLPFELCPPETRTGLDCRALVANSDLGGVSIGFFGARDRWSRKGSLDYREILECELEHISPCYNPIQKQTTIDLRSIRPYNLKSMDLQLQLLEKLRGAY